MLNTKMDFTRLGKQNIRGFQRNGYLFIPGLFFILIGLVAVFAPMLLLGVIAAFCISLGLIFCVLTWKFLRLKRNLDKVAKDFSQQFQGSVQIRGMRVDGRSPFAEEEESDDYLAEYEIKEVDPKKIIFH